MCSTSTNVSKWHLYFIDEKLAVNQSSSNESSETNKNEDEKDFTSQNLIQIQQSALMNILVLKSNYIFCRSMKYNIKMIKKRKNEIENM
jgi:hypothetical protein